jgi:hypothetical protein
MALSEEDTMRSFAMALGVLFACASADAQIIKDPPWNPEHIDHLPPDVRNAVIAKCPQKPNAGHYFATYFQDEIHLHYEHLHCDAASFCNGSQCLHQVYKLSGGHYRLLRFQLRLKGSPPVRSASALGGSLALGN